MYKIWLCMLCMTMQAQAAILHTISLRQLHGKASLFFALNMPVAHQIFTLTNPDRVVVDFEHTQLGFDLHKIQQSQLIKLVRSGHPKPNVLRLVFEVRNAVQLSGVQKPIQRGNNRMFAVDLAAKNQQMSGSQHYRPMAKRVAVPQQHNIMIVAIDPGHAGHDPGAIGPHGIQEKQLTLSIAQRLKQIIDQQPRMHAVLTRQGDYYVGLRQRLTIARRYNSDVFISIHADAFNNQRSSGVSIFALSQRGATSEAARWLAAKENYSELGGVNLSCLHDQTGVIRTVLIDLSQTATIGASLQMGTSVLDDLNRMTS